MPALQALINAALPQTQCTRCGFADCAAYAQAIAEHQAGINQCPPGGDEGVQRLAALTGLPLIPLNPAHGQAGERQLAVIDEDWCIGCTLCLEACPTDAIVGSNKHMHVVLPQWCTGCELCLPVCPVDCIALRSTGPATGWAAWSEAQAQDASARYARHRQRLAREAQELHERQERQARRQREQLQAPAATAPEAGRDADAGAPRLGFIQGILAKARAQQAQPGAQALRKTKPE